MTASLAYVLGGGNGLVWSWLFWVYIHPLASIMWFAFCLFALLISIEIRHNEVDHLAEAKSSSLTYIKKTKLGRPITLATTTTAFSATEVVEVIVQTPPQLPYKTTHQHRNPQVVVQQLPSTIE